ncbi:hypothetical protein DYB25_010337 [Aphanomyces astaci]|uniref:Uncharacterized protein n=1 Tax=Aphanomyces astaci TaxID=112090 RepID=A0A397ADI2_APHAT|nr:hypothetical protein DYB36_002981 [Aphanomyces astaci]RHY05126.1 hypothetical protein DYB25_010337 [Aphanomyces astaci]RHY38666.1 hypothetical protein DYB30_007309 [Aphanomyces astaci]RHY65568.1 hypothetical protein DYB34_006798 [Aphanomyces astaci]RHY97055.1 hypothetical protein DYB31_007201 [Aphanomyces astaci]
MGNCSGRDLEAVEARVARPDTRPMRAAAPDQSHQPQRRRSKLAESFQRRKSNSFFERSSSSMRQKAHRFSLNFMPRQESDIPIAEDSPHELDRRKGAPRTPDTEYYRSDTDEISIDIDLILGHDFDSPGIIHARWGEPSEDDDEVCMDYQANPFKVGFCINCQKQHEFTEAGEVKAIKEYKRISALNVWQLQLPTNPNISIAPEAMIGVGRTNASYSQRNLRLSTLSDGGRESDVDLTQILKQRRDILLKLQQAKTEKAPAARSSNDDSWL